MFNINVLIVIFLFLKWQYGEKMKMKNVILLVIVFTMLMVGIIVYLFLDEKKTKTNISQNGIVKALEFGNAGEYGYITVHYNGTGNLTIIALSEQPKTKIIVFRQDFLNTGQYSYFMDLLRVLGKKGFFIDETDSITAPQNSIILIPSGAMPINVLKRIDNLTATNEIIYLGKKDFIYTDKLERFDWFSNLSTHTKEHILIIEKTLDEFYLEKNYSLFEQIERNSWAEKNLATFSYFGDGDKTYFIKLNGAQWLRMLPLADSKQFTLNRAEINGTFDIFPWQKAQITVQINHSNGTAEFVLEKDKKIIQRGELDRVRNNQAFFLVFSFNSSGNYLLKVFDHDGIMAAKHIHVKDVNVSFVRAYGNSYEFSVFLDNQPLENAPVIIGLNHSTTTVENEVKNGVLLVHANLKQGENIFIIRLFGQQHYLLYNNTQENITAFYAKYLALGIIIIAIFYFVMHINKKSIYRIRVPEGVFTRNPEIKLKADEIISALKDMEKMFGWKNTPLYAKEIGIGLKRLTGGMEVNEGNTEAILKKLEEKGLIKNYIGLYGLTEWGDAKCNALKRIIKDKLVQNGVEFTENKFGFDIGEKQIVLDSETATKEAISVFEDRADMRSYISLLNAKKRAIIDLKIKNSILKLATLDELDELI